MAEMRFYDAHNHLQDERLRESSDEIMSAVRAAGLQWMVVNGTSPADWKAVDALADAYAEVLPSFGVHPWHAGKVEGGWVRVLRGHLTKRPSAVGEIGLDRWIEGYDLPRQEEVFLAQWRLAGELNRPVSLHCLKAWGRLFDLLRAEERSKSGFLLHSYGGPLEMVKPLADLGAYFSMSGYFAHPRKAAQAEVFRQVPGERLLLETDAPDMGPPDRWNDFPLRDADTGKSVNHPGNIVAVYRYASELRGESMESLAARVEDNFQALFGGAGTTVPEKAP